MVVIKNKKTFYKITNNTENHNGFQYKTGLNILDSKFDPSSNCGGGLHFSNRENILHFIIFGDNIRELVVPDDAKIVKIKGVPLKYKTDKLILKKEKYPVYSRDTIQRLKLKVNRLYLEKYFCYANDCLEDKVAIAKQNKKLIHQNKLCYRLKRKSAKVPRI